MIKKLSDNLIYINLIKEDSKNPRKDNNDGFSKEKIEALAESIKAGGIKVPISVRSDPDKHNHFIINHGARRYRAAKLAGLDMIPAYIDEKFKPEDQILENLQREELDPLEIAESLNELVSQGHKQNEIASRIGVSPSWVTLHISLLKLPEWLLEKVKSKEIGNITLANAIHSFIKKHANFEEEVKTWIETTKDITESTFKLEKNILLGEDEQPKNTPDNEAGATEADTAGTDTPEVENINSDSTLEPDSATEENTDDQETSHETESDDDYEYKEEGEPKPISYPEPEAEPEVQWEKEVEWTEKRKKWQLYCQFDGYKALLVPTIREKTKGNIVIRYMEGENKGEETEIALDEVELIEIEDK